MALPQIAAGLSIASSLFGMSGGISGNRRARKALRNQAWATWHQRQRENQLIRQQMDQVEGENINSVFASNLQMSGTTKNFMREVRADFAAEMQFRRKAQEMERNSLIKSGPGAGANFATVARGVSGIAGAITNYNRTVN